MRLNATEPPLEQVASVLSPDAQERQDGISRQLRGGPVAVIVDQELGVRIVGHVPAVQVEVELPAFEVEFLVDADVELMKERKPRVVRREAREPERMGRCFCIEEVKSLMLTVVNCTSARRRGGREAEGGGLLNRYTG